MQKSSVPAETAPRHAALQTALARVEHELLTPALVIDLDAVDHNTTRFIAHVGGARRWRPHIKTVKQARIVADLMRKGVRWFKCATLDELALILEAAERIEPDGHVDVLLAYPLTKPATTALVQLMAGYEGGRIRLLADSPGHLRALGEWLAQLHPARGLEVLLDVDIGMRRTGSTTGVWIQAREQVVSTPQLRAIGLHGYDGHLGWDEREQAHRGYDDLLKLAAALPASAAQLLITSGTHSFEHALTHDGLCRANASHQVSPGTLVLSDLRSAAPAHALGLQQAAFVVSRVIARPGEDRVTLDAGSKAMCPDVPAPSCAVVGWPELTGLTASEEHRPFAAPVGGRPELGALLWLVPAHICTTVNLHRTMHFVRGGEYIGRGDIQAMSRTSMISDPRP